MRITVPIVRTKCGWCVHANRVRIHIHKRQRRGIFIRCVVHNVVQRCRLLSS
jgi:hypothetical protein